MSDNHYQKLWEQVAADRDWYKGLLFDAWKSLAGQTRGLQRQRKLIKRLQAENSILKIRLSSPQSARPPGDGV